ncbi:MAG: hypothetical protein ACLSGA_10815 [Ruminococcus sp.]
MIRHRGGHRPNQGGRNQMSRIPKHRSLLRSRNRKRRNRRSKEITIPEKLTIRELAEAMKMQPSAIVRSCSWKVRW